MTCIDKMNVNTHYRTNFLRFIFILLMVSIFCFGKVSAQDDVEIIPANIRANHFATAVGNIRLHHFSEDSALIKLFPGKFYKIKDQGETYTFEAWKCLACKRKQFVGEWLGMSDTFPRKEGNDTRVVGSLRYKGENGNDFILLATSSIELGSLILMGRFSCGVLGIAIFENVKDEWILRAFNSDIVCAGRFSSAPMPALLRSDCRVYACSISSSNGFAGGPYYGDLYVIGVTQPYLKELLHYSLAERGYDAKNEWSSKIYNGMDTSETLPDITITTKGHYGAYSFDYGYGGEIDSVVIRNFLGDAIERKDSCDFVIKSRYHFSNGRFKQMSRKVSILK
jgi:hypothetical protein